MPYCTYVSCSPCTHQHRTILILCRDSAPTRNKPSGWIRLSSQICSGLLGNCPKAPCRKASGAGARTRAWSQALYPVHSTAWVTPPSVSVLNPGIKLQVFSWCPVTTAHTFHIKVPLGLPYHIFHEQQVSCKAWQGWEFTILLPLLDLPSWMWSLPGVGIYSPGVGIYTPNTIHWCSIATSLFASYSKSLRCSTHFRQSSLESSSCTYCNFLCVALYPSRCMIMLHVLYGEECMYFRYWMPPYTCNRQ